jgi:hypothetical protein
VLQFLIVLAILATVVLVVSAPIRRARMAQGATAAAGPDPDADASGTSAGEPDRAQASEVAELEAARDAKYREIRDAELDHRTGKLSDADFEAVDRGLRAEAVEILHRLDRARRELDRACGELDRGRGELDRGPGGAGDDKRDSVPQAHAGADPPGSSRI